MVTSEELADVWEGRAQETPAEVHRNLPRKGDVATSSLRAEIGGTKREVVAHGPRDVVEGHRRLGGLEDHLQYLTGEIDADLPPRERCVGAKADEEALQLPDVRGHLPREEQGHVVGERDVLHLGLLLENGHAGLDVGGLDVRDQPPLEAVSQALLEVGNLLRHLVRGEDDLAPVVVERVERVEELLLGSLAACQELHVVQDEDVDAAEPLLEVAHAIATERGDEVVHERVGGEVRDANQRLAFEDLVADGVHQVRFAATDAAVHEERVVVVAGL